MNLSSKSMIVASVAFSLSAAMARAAEPVNMLQNGGFEEGKTGWTADPQHSLVDEKAAAHSGSACLTGTLTEPKRALRLRQSVAVKAGNRYEFEIWARATNRTKLVLFAVQPGTTARRSLAAWQNVPRKWQKYSVPISVQRDGKLQLEIIAPSSHAAPAGQIWVDDVALYETEMPPLVSVSDGVGFNDEPALARSADGSVYVAWNSFRKGADSLQVARYKLNGKTFQKLGQWQILAGTGTYVLEPDAVGAGKGAVVVYAAEEKKNWDIYAVVCGPDGPDRPIRVTNDAAVDVKPAAAWHDGTLWVTWESNRDGARRIFAASVCDGEVSEPVAVSRDGASSYNPSVTVLSGGKVCVAWHSFRDNNFDVFLGCSNRGGAWGKESRLTRDPSIDRHAVVFSRGDELWVAYENAWTDAYYVGRTNRRRLIVAKVTPEGLLAPKHASKTSPLDGRCEAANAAFDSDGRLWLSFLKPRLPRSGWDTYLTCFAGGRWQTPSPASVQKGMDRRPALVLAGDRAIVAFQGDNTPNSWSDLDKMKQATSDIYLAAIDTGSTPTEPAMELAPLAESEEPFEPAQIRIERGEDTPASSIDYNGQTLNLYFGNLHEHTEVSVCNRVGDQSIDESYQCMRDLTRHDFACVTDHGYNINPYIWGRTAKLNRINHDPGRFLTFLGEEWTSTFEEYSQEHPFGFYGHRNLIFADPYFPRWWNARNRQTPAQVWEDLRKMNANFVHIPHQLADTGNVPTDWNFTDEVAQPVAEIFQTRGSYEYRAAPRAAGRLTPTSGYFLQDAWARGIVIGVIASPDHGGGYGKACVFAPELTSEAILDAIRARHCYGTTAAKIFLDVRVNGHLMGEKIAEEPGKRVEIKITARCPADIDRIEICRNNKFIYTNKPKGKQADIKMTDDKPLSGRSYYYVRVLQKDEEVAWSSPVWFGAK